MKKSTTSVLLLTFLGAALAVFAAEAAKAPGTVFLDYVDSHGADVRLSFNPSDLGAEPLASPLLALKNGDTVWLGTSERLIEATCGRLTLDERHARYRGGVVVEIMPPTLLPRGYALLSLKPLPKQRWKVVPLSKDDRAFVATIVKAGEANPAFPPVRIDSEALGQFLLINEQQKTRQAEFPSFRTMLFQDEDGRWVKREEFTDQGAEPLVDVDGDGFPEVAGPTGDKSYILRRMVPHLAVVTENSSGV